MANSITGSATAIGPRPAIVTNTYVNPGRFALSIWGTFVASLIIERSVDNGTTWVPYLTPAGAVVSLTSPGVFVIEDPDIQARYRINVMSYTSGTVTFGFSP